MSTKYQGWTNYETFNVALYINNEEDLYFLACDYVRQAKKAGAKVSYDNLIPAIEYRRKSQITPDGVRWMDGLINTEEMDEMLEELVA
jgi:NAD-dependent DNA ligase